MMDGVIVGDRIRLIKMPDDPNPVPAGTLGTVRRVTILDGWTQIGVDWDNKQTLSLCCPPDSYAKI